MLLNDYAPEANWNLFFILLEIYTHETKERRFQMERTGLSSSVIYGIVIPLGDDCKFTCGHCGRYELEQTIGWIVNRCHFSRNNGWGRSSSAVVAAPRWSRTVDFLPIHSSPPLIYYPTLKRAPHSFVFKPFPNVTKYIIVNATRAFYSCRSIGSDVKELRRKAWMNGQPRTVPAA